MTYANITLIPFSDRPAWEAASVGALPGQSWGHAAGLADDGFTPELAVIDSPQARLILPFSRRSIHGITDIATLPGLSGAWASANSFAPFAAWSDFAAQQGWVAGYIQLSPENNALPVPPPDRLKSTNSLYVFDLESWDITQSVSKYTRRSMKEGDKIGAQLVTDIAAMKDAFPELYAGHLDRLGGRGDFSEPCLRRWFDTAGIIAFGAMLDGRIVNVQMGRRHGPWADLHLAGATPEGRHLQAWVYWQTIMALRREGVRYLNIGGYGTPGDGLHWMKARLGAAEHPLRAICQIYDPERYAQLCAQMGTVDTDDGFFPAYRARPKPE